jgi:dihydropteroate synthase
MAVVNITPDSFYNGGRLFASERAIMAIRGAFKAGAHIVDIGAESTRPNAVPVDAETEQYRLKPILELLPRENFPLLSIDTYKSSTAALCLQHGVHIVNDIHGLQGDPNMAAVVAQYNALACVMHGAAPNYTPAYDDITADVQHFWQQSATIACKAGIAAQNLSFDIGVGFGKTDAQLWELLKALPQLVASVAPCPVLVGASRKSFLGRLLQQPKPQQRLAGTLAVHTLAWQAGAHIVRGHDTAQHLNALTVLQAMAG